VLDSLDFDVDRLWPYFGVRATLACWLIAALFVRTDASEPVTQAVWGLTLIYRFVAFMTLKLKPVKPNLS
jgi:hypothetical protein